MDINKYIKIVDDISKKYNYENNIKHLLYIILPSFVIKYGREKENLIIDCFNNIPIIITGKEDNISQASYISIPYFDTSIKTKKMILLNRYNNIPFMQLLDNLIHELNHALNSYKKEIILKENTFYLRTGLYLIEYDKKTFKIINKNKSYILEEIINSKQAETIIDIISKLTFNNIDVNLENTLYAIKNSISNNYISNSYYNLKYFCKTLLDNKTFLFTLENLRINGDIEDIKLWFNNIYGDDIYDVFIDTLYKLKEINKNDFFKKQKIKKLALKLIEISNTFNNNCNLK